jgi:uncharacterized protein YdhG (YjbR/CyaY superfamily)
MQKVKPKTIEEYIDAASPAAVEKLVQLHECIRDAAPGAVENLKWSMPAYSYQKILVTWAVFKNHIGLYPMPDAMKHFEKSLVRYTTGKGSIQFPLDQPLPLALIRRIIKYRVKQSKDGTLTWRSSQ